MTQLQDCIEKLSTIPIDTNRYLRHIRQLDKKIQEAFPILAEKQKQFLQKARLYKEKRLDSQGLEAQYNEIIKLQKLYYGMSMEKVKVAEQLRQLLNEPANQIATKIKNQVKIERTQEDVKDDSTLPYKKKKLKTESKLITKGDKKQENKEWLYDKNAQSYCYCMQGSFGQMVECEYPFCEREWFHKECINQKISQEQEWFCQDCRKLRENMNNSTMKHYLK